MKRYHWSRMLFAGLALIVLAATAQAQTKDLSAEEQELIQLVNAERSKAKLKVLVENPKLTTAARTHNKNMLSSKVFAHTIGDSTLSTRLGAVKYDLRAAGENISGRDSAKDTVTGWMNSAAHKDNILGERFREIGVSRMKDGDTIRWTLVVAFDGTEPKPVEPPAKKTDDPQPKKAEGFTFTEVLPFKMNGLNVYEFEVTSDKPFSLRLASPKTITTAVKRGNAISGVERLPNGEMLYKATMKQSLLDNSLDGEWTLEIIYQLPSRKGNDFPSSFSVKFNKMYTR